jgi:hypothetical protein
MMDHAAAFCGRFAKFATSEGVRIADGLIRLLAYRSNVRKLANI